MWLLQNTAVTTSVFFLSINQSQTELNFDSGDLSDEHEMLEWMIKNKSSADDDDVLEMVNGEQLEIMVDNVDNLLVYFYDNTRMSMK